VVSPVDLSRRRHRQVNERLHPIAQRGAHLRNVLRGTGLILLRVAPHCEHYVATDFSQIALDQVRGEIEKAPGEYRHVRLRACAANELDGLDGPFDLIILNSVIQYFPSLEYLTQVLSAAIRLTASTGAILIGDVRSLPLLPAFHTAVELHHAPDALTVDQLQARIQKQLAQEKELAFAPIVFHGFGPDISQVTVDLKRGTLTDR
jgi:ubiquinone/menaquinone biosynthesis C-methylase UbiE